ncbi:MAG: flavodoxin domain-containing protein [Desulfosarcinaceae bacterium]|nr:flavodoxin domain-containing protein [Desulfosarcinaceae bacterium]
MAKVLIVCASRTGETRQIGDLIAEGVRIAGHEAEVLEAREITTEEQLSGCDALVLGSATYHGEMLPKMKQVLFLAEKAALAGKIGGAFGAFGWSGEATDRIFETMHHIFNMEMVAGPLRLKSSQLAGGIRMAHDYGRELVEKITAA